MSAETFVATVIVPVRNAAGVVKEQLEALKHQTLPGPLQILVVDDHSVDGTADLIAQWIQATPDSGFALIRRTRRGGPNASRNDGIRVACAPILLFCDGDDVVDRRWAEVLVGEIDENSLLGGVVREFRDGCGFGIRQDEKLPQRYGWTYAWGGNMAMSASLAQRLGGFDETILYGGTEVEFAIRAQLAGVTIRQAPEAVVNYRLPSRPRNLFYRQFRKERGNAYIHRKFTDRVDTSRDFRHFLGAVKGSVLAGLKILTLRPETRLVAMSEFGRLCGWIVWYVRFLLFCPHPKTLAED